MPYRAKDTEGITAPYLLPSCSISGCVHTHACVHSRTYGGYVKRENQRISPHRHPDDEVALKSQPLLLCSTTWDFSRYPSSDSL